MTPLRRFARRTSAALAASYLAALVTVILAMTLVGEDWWPTTVLLYLPRVGFALPLPLVALALALFGPRRWLLALPVPLALVLFPLMGLRMNVFRGDTAPARPSLRVVSFNVAAVRDADALLAQLRPLDADLVLLQEFRKRLDEPLREGLPALPHRHTSGPFHVMSRFPLRDVDLPPSVRVAGAPERSARYVRYAVDSPLGTLTVYNVHPLSPRSGMSELRTNTLRRQLRDAQDDAEESARKMTTNARVRERQVASWAEDAAAAPQPVLIAGDTNLPGLSRIFGRHLADFDDGFDAAGRGFGYTFPAHRPWMRIDRILARGLRFHRFETIDSNVSDHLCVWADVSPPDAR